MNTALLGKKCGMTRIFTEDGNAIPVTVLEILPNRVSQIKNKTTDGYAAIQITTGEAPAKKKINKPTAGHFAKAGVVPGKIVREIRLLEADLAHFTNGTEIKVDVFQEGQFVDVIGITKGKGFAGVLKKHHFSAQDATHGNSLSHRRPGSIGQRQSPGKVFKGKRMAGHLGDVRRTILSLQIARVDAEKNLLFIKGAVPGSPNCYLMVRLAVKKH